MHRMKCSLVLMAFLPVWDGWTLNFSVPVIAQMSLIVPADKGDGDIALVSVCTSIHPVIRLSQPWFPGIFSKSFDSIYINPSMFAYWVSVQIWLDFRPCGQYLALQWAKNGSNLRFPDINWKGFHSIHFKPCQYAYWWAFRNFSIFGPLA